MIEKLGSKEWERAKTNNKDTKSYIPQQLNFSKWDLEDQQEAEKILAQLEGGNESEQKKIQVRNKPCVVWEKTWIYEGSWLSWWKNNFNNPWGKWRFVCNDWAVLDWFWNDNGVFTRGKAVVKWKSFDITKARVYTNDKTKLSTLHWTGNVDWVKYSCVLDKNLELSEIIYAWVTLKLVHEGWRTYLRNKGWKRLLIASDDGLDAGSHIRPNKIFEKEDSIAVKIAKAISIVKNSWKKLDEFERNEIPFVGITVQADYKDTFFDVDLINAASLGGVESSDLVDWLNASRKDFGI